MKRTRIVKAFDLGAAIPAAWKLIWEQKEKDRVQNERDAKRTGRTGYRDDRVFYTTASDVENQVRQFAIDDAAGTPRGKVAWGKPQSWPPVRITTNRGTLQGVVRDWLLDEVRRGRIDSHNFGRHHISGMRFRPHGAPLTEQETKTIAKNEEQRTNPKARPHHYSERGFVGRPLCIAHVRKGFSYRQSKAWTTKKQEEVTCPRCLKILKNMKTEKTA